MPLTDTIFNMLLQVVPSRKTFAAHLADGQSSLRVKQSVKLEEWLLRLRMLSGYMLSIGFRGAKILIEAGKDLLRGSIELRSYMSRDVVQSACITVASARTSDRTKMEEGCCVNKALRSLRRVSALSASC